LPLASARFRAPSREKIETAELDVNVVSPNYFAAMGLPLVVGRIFPKDSAPRTCRVGVINEEAADHCVPVGVTPLYAQPSGTLRGANLNDGFYRH
jgi:hypothetical protein